MKYKNIKEVIKAFKAGELDGWALFIDNDFVKLTWIGSIPNLQDEDDTYIFMDSKYDEGYDMYHEDITHGVIVEALMEILGIPFEWA